MLTIALRMLFGDHAKYFMLVSGVAFSTLLMIQGSSTFSGLMSWTASNVRTMRADLWIADPKVEQANDNKPMRDTDVARVRSVPGVAWASPLHVSNVQAKREDGVFKLVQIVGLDNTTLAGAPEVIVGSLDDLRLPNAVLLDEYGVERLSEGLGRPFGVGDVLDINDREARVVGLVKAARSFTGGPYIFTTFDRATQYAPRQRKMTTFVLAGVEPGANHQEVAQRISAETGLRASTESDFLWSTVFWYVRNTGIPISVGTIVFVGFISGAGVVAQTFFTFVLENQRYFAAFKAMGASTWLLVKMLLLQAFTVGLIGYGIGLGGASLFGFRALVAGQPPYFMPIHVPLIFFGAVMTICTLSALLGIWRIARLEPASVFRA